MEILAIIGAVVILLVCIGVFLWSIGSLTFSFHRKD